MKNKNLVIIGLLSALLVMVVGYAAFSTQLNINGTANITSSWNVAFDTTKTNTYVPTAGISGGETPTGSISYSGGQSATITANLQQPGDKVVFTLTIQNTGSLAANLGTPSLSGTSCTVSGLTCTSTSGHIKFTVTNPASTTLPASTGTTTMTVTAEYPDTTVSSSSAESAKLTITLNATQA